MAAKTVQALYVGSAPARLDPQGIDLIPGKTVVEIDEGTAKRDAIWKIQGKASSAGKRTTKRTAKKDGKTEAPVPAPMNAETPAIPDAPPVQPPPIPDAGDEG